MNLMNLENEKLPTQYPLSEVLKKYIGLLSAVLLIALANLLLFKLVSIISISDVAHLVAILGGIALLMLSFFFTRFVIVQPIEPLLAALRNENKEVRRWAAVALGWIGDKRAVEPLLAALRDEDEGVRHQVFKALGRIGTPAIEPLLAALRGKIKR